ncbi:MAG: NAD(P)H-dependent oxidoreductase [Taibaiella sp.]|nr:NAD(P)H-dependent oxidoreductase [Taibaiella sp.]
MTKTIGIFVGSLRKASFSRKLAENIRDMAPAGFEFKMMETGHLPLYNQDYDDHHEVPQSYMEFREEVKGLEGVLFITPEYNRSVPAVLKNALDVASRPYGKNCWDNKPGAVFSSSMGNIAGFGANHHLRQCLVFLNVPVMQQPEVYLPQIQNCLDEHGKLKTDTEELVKKAVDAYIRWFNRLIQ